MEKVLPAQLLGNQFSFLYRLQYNLDSNTKILVKHNCFYASNALPEGDWRGENSLHPYDNAQQEAGWSDPDRTLRRYVTEVLALSLLDWNDNPFLDEAEKQLRKNAGEEYDPTGMKTFMAVTTNMRYSGTDTVPSSGKPNMLGDYPWDTRFTAVEVMN